MTSSHGAPIKSQDRIVTNASKSQAHLTASQRSAESQGSIQWPVEHREGSGHRAAKALQSNQKSSEYQRGRKAARRAPSSHEGSAERPGACQAARNGLSYAMFVGEHRASRRMLHNQEHFRSPLVTQSEQSASPKVRIPGAYPSEKSHLVNE